MVILLIHFNGKKKIVFHIPRSFTSHSAFLITFLLDRHGEDTSFHAGRDN